MARAAQSMVAGVETQIRRLPNRASHFSQVPPALEIEAPIRYVSSCGSDHTTLDFSGAIFTIFRILVPSSSPGMPLTNQTLP